MSGSQVHHLLEGQVNRSRLVKMDPKRADRPSALLAGIAFKVRKKVAKMEKDNYSTTNVAALQVRMGNISMRTLKAP